MGVLLRQGRGAAGAALVVGLCVGLVPSAAWGQIRPVPPRPPRPFGISGPGAIGVPTPPGGAGEGAAPGEEGAEPSLFDQERHGFITRVGRGKLLHTLRTGAVQDRVRAASELGRRREEAAVPVLLEELRSAPSTGIRTAIIDALGEIGDRRAVPSLLGLLEARGREQVAATRALGRIGDPRALDPIADLVGQPSVSDEAAEALLNLGPRVLLRVVALTREPATAGPACAILGRLGDRRATWPMVKALQSPRARVRGQCVEALGVLGDPRAQRAVAALLQDPQEPVRRRALDALLLIADGSASGVFAPLVGGEVHWVKVLPALRGPEARGAVEEVAQIASGDSGPLRGEAVDALARIGGPEATAVLSGLLVARMPAMRYQAATALARMPRADALEPLLGAARAEGEARPEALRGLGDLLRAAPLGEEAGPPPAEARRLGRSLIGAKQPELAGSAAYLSGAMRDRGAVVGLRGLLDRPSPALRAQAVTSLGWIGGRRACAAIAEGLSDPDDGVRAAAAWAAGEAACLDTGPRLEAMVDSGSSRTGGNAAWALSVVRYRQALPTLRRRLTEGGPVVRANAALALADLGDGRSLPTIRERARQEGSPHVRAALVDALGRLPEPRSRAALELLTELPGVLGALARDALRAVETDRPLVQPRGSDVFRTRVVDGDGQPRSGVFFTLALPDRRMMTGLTDPCGEITVIGLPEGEVHLGIGRAPGG